MALTVLNPTILGQVLEALPGAFDDEDLVAVLLRDFPEQYTREIGARGQAIAGDGIERTLEELIEALQSPPLTARVKETSEGSWKRLDDVPPGQLPEPPNRAVLRRGFGRRGRGPQ